MSMPNYFAYDPFTRRTRTTRYAPQGDQDTWSAYDQEEEYWDVSDALRGADPRLAENWGNGSNMQVERDGDGYRVRVKTGDKEGTWYNLQRDAQGGYTPTVAGKGEWNTNENLFDDPIALAMMAAVGGIGAAGYAAGAGGAGALTAETAAEVAAATGLPEITPQMLAAANATSDPLGYLLTLANGGTGAGALGTIAADALAGLTTVGASAASGLTTVGASAASGAANSLVRGVAEALGVSEDIAKLIVTAAPAVLTGIGNLTEDDEDNQVTRTGNPTIDAAREGVVNRMMSGLDERIARDRARSDQLAGWSTAAAAIPQSLPQYRGLMETDEFGRVRFRKPQRGLTG
jgi:hypothetical protein